MTPLVFSAQMKCRHWADNSQGGFPVLWASALKKKKLLAQCRSKFMSHHMGFFCVFFFRPAQWPRGTAVINITN